MTFSEHLQKGLEQARAAVKAHRAISALLNQFVSEVNQATHKDLRLEHARVPADPDDQRRHLKPSWQRDFTDVVLFGAGQAKTVLIRVTKAPAGFPAELAYADELVWCVDEGELESSLGRALENPQVASLLQPEQVTAAG